MKKNLLEWGVFAFGLAAIGAVIFGLARDAAAPAGPPDLKVVAAKAAKTGDRWLVPVTVRNDGGEAAEAVTVRARAGDQEAEFDIEYIPRESSRSGYLIFRDEPEALKVDVTGAGSP